MCREFLLLLACFLAAATARAGEKPEQVFDVPAGDAVTTLNAFAAQSGEEVIYVVNKVRGIRTNPVQGRFTAREALVRMLAETRLVAVEDIATGTIMIQRAGENEHSIPKTGTISGTVMNRNTRRFLERARVRVDGTSLETLTESDGTFRLHDVPPGPHVAVASYAGLNDEPIPCTVMRGATSRLEFALTSVVYQLESFVVTSGREGSSYAVNQQRRAESQRSVTSIDTYGNNVSGNVGEFFRHLSGIQMDFNQVEPSAIRVRGFDPWLTHVTMDGHPIASVDSNRLNRLVAVDQLALGTIENVEVLKAPLPSRSANAIGGIVNFNSRSAFEQEGRRASLELGLTANSHQLDFRRTPGGGHTDTPGRKVIPVGRLDYSNTFWGDRLGLVVAVGHTKTWVPADSERFSLVARPLPGSALPPVPAEFNQDNVAVRRHVFGIAPNQQHIRRSYASLNTDLRLSDRLELYVRSTFADYKSTNRQHELMLTPTSVDPASTLTRLHVLEGGVTQSGNVFDKYTKTWQVNPGLRFRAEDWRIEASVAWSNSTNHYRNPSHFSNGASLRLRSPAGWRVSIPTDTDLPTSLIQTSGPDLYDLDNYVVNQVPMPADGVMGADTGGFVVNNRRDASESIWSGRVDVTRRLAGPFPLHLQAGIAWTGQERVRRNPREKWLWVGPDGTVGGGDDLAPPGGMGIFAEPVAVPDVFGLRSPTYFSSKLIKEYMDARPQAFVRNAAYAFEQAALNFRRMNETVTAAYLTGTAQIGPLHLLAGVRAEQTDVSAWGPRSRPSLVPPGVKPDSLEGLQASLSLQRSSASYDRLGHTAPLKFLHLKYEWLPGLQTRASYTEAIGRPNLDQILPKTSIDDTTPVPTVSVTNTALRPQRSRSYDFSLEYYTGAAGEFTVAWWDREVQGYAATTAYVLLAPDAALGLGSEFIGATIVTTANLHAARFNGYEIGFTQSLRNWAFVPEALHGFELWANHTRNYRMTGEFGAPGARITQLANVAPTLYNGGVRYRSPTGRFAAALSTTHQSAIPTAHRPIQSEAAQVAQQIDPWQFWNLDLSVQLAPRVLLKCTARNLLAKRRTISQMGGIVVNQQNDSGTFWVLSLKYDL